MYYGWMIKSDDDAARRTDWSRIGLDWIDLLIIVAFATGMTLLFGLIGWRPRGILAGLTLAPPLIAALTFRRKVLPPARRGPVAKRFSLLGVIATMLMVFGLVVGLIGAFGASRQMSSDASPVATEDVRALARARAHAEMTPEVGATVSAEDAAKVVTETGTFEGLMAALGSGPSEEAIGRHEAAVRRELEAEAEERARERRAEGVAFAARVAAIALAMVALGGWLDSRRPRAPT